jgi:hypothetical protein
LQLACCIQPKTEPHVSSSMDSATSDWINGTTGIASWNASEGAKTSDGRTDRIRRRDS